ncbi:hypothetical protein J2W32_004806 [Variovorax boronicumulans]|uniref:Lipoprotein n=1 Tax=Variovorax boronicumulans TaxID=436515 RepID=A0AAW8D6N4_9BURK|nr:hypothetical protein [Variovorax boronicumulans]MDP9895546.1 hypothetical protein [Variovorax boronicumulans]MDQ0041420.1 hypothetical protein [Variovorax boronicumulans]MDQ0055746.1 hypothetical protein [Variovorax boronicumulans]
MSPALRASVLWAFALGGCTAFDAHSLDRAAGWHAAQVVAVGRAGDLSGTADRNCGAAGDASARYAVVRYHNGGVHSRSLGTDRLPADTELKVGDAVYVNILDCAAPLMMTPDQSGSMSGAPSR